MFKTIYLLIFLSLSIGILFVLLKNHIKFKKKQKMSDEYHVFSMQVIEWAKEIKDQNKRSELLKYHITYIFTSYSEEDNLKCEKIPEFKKYIEDNWGGYIPSLKQKIRERKINSILE